MLEELERSGLRGRGGAGFPVAVKMRAVAGRPAPRTVVVNGSESEPASRKDRLLLARAPHLVLDGAALAADLVGANRVVVCVKQSAGSAVEALFEAARERRDAGLEEVEPTICEVAPDYVAGEESALVHQLNGGLAKPTFAPPRPFESGVGGEPTLLQNVETLAHVALVSRFGAGWFRELGTADDPGSVLITISGAVARPGVYEVAAGTRVGSLIKAAGSPTEPLQAVLIGGYAGRWYGIERGLEIAVGHQSLRGVGGTLGPGVVIALPRGACGVAETAAVASYLARESSGQCGPCVHGLAAIADALSDIASGHAPLGTREWVARWSEDVRGRGACHHPDGAARLVSSCLEVFTEEVDRHERGRPCLPPPPLKGLLPLKGDPRDLVASAR
jgi:NADH:ubiquinone oxidoreductase subunit F (NADH-binding)